jgi:hypothetical protein
LNSYRRSEEDKIPGHCYIPIPPGRMLIAGRKKPRRSDEPCVVEGAEALLDAVEKLPSILVVRTAYGTKKKI